VACAFAAVAAAVAADSTPRLLMFGNETNPRGRWSYEVLESTDPETRKLMGQAGQMSVCMDAANEMGREKDKNAPEDDCTTKILKNTASVAQVETVCPPDRKTLMTLTRESKDSVLFELTDAGGGGAPASQMKGRYRYQGACSASDAAISFDKNSEVCQQMRESLKELDAASTCGELPAEQKAACLSMVESQLANVRKMCE
jgi:hypothetical protein